MIEGFLDIVLPDDAASDSQAPYDRSKPQPPSVSVDNLYTPDEFAADSESDFSSIPGVTKRQSTGPHGSAGSTLFTVKPGGIAGYLGTMPLLSLMVASENPHSQSFQYGQLRRHYCEDGHVCRLTTA